MGALGGWGDLWVGCAMGTRTDGGGRDGKVSDMEFGTTEGGRCHGRAGNISGKEGQGETTGNSTEGHMRIYGGMEDTKKPDAGGLDSLEPDKWVGGEIRDGWMEEAGDSSWMGGGQFGQRV